jgi:hypothetical protein
MPQGPPGTGKTSAVLAITSAILASASRPTTDATGVHGAGAGDEAHAAALAAKKQSYKRPSAAKRKQQQQQQQQQQQEAAAGGVKEGGAAGGDLGQGQGEEGVHRGPLQLGVIPPVRILVCAQSNAGE